MNGATAEPAARSFLTRAKRFIIANKDLIEAISLMLTATIALISAALFWHTSRETSRFQGEVVANETWERYREIGLTNEDLTRGNVDFLKLDERQKSRYALLVERLLMAADLIAVTAPNDVEWRAAFELEFVKHRSYLLSQYFLYGAGNLPSEYCTYRRNARNWIVYAFRNEKGGPLRAAEQKCMEKGFTD